MSTLLRKDISSKKATSQKEEGKESFFGVQAKLSIGKSNDKYEVEADRVADQVVANKQNKSSDSFFSPSPVVQKKLANEVQKQDEKNEEIQTKEEVSKQQSSIGDATSNDTSGLENKLNSSKGSGTSLSGNTKKEMESGFGTDFSNVKVHTDSNAVQMNKQLGSQAFANGNNVYFNEGKYNPNSQSGKHLLAHELTHTVQQGASKPAVQAKMIPAETKPNPVKNPTVKNKTVQKPETETKTATDKKAETNNTKTVPANPTAPNKISPPVAIENIKPKEGQASTEKEGVDGALQEGTEQVEGKKETVNPVNNATTPVDVAKPATDSKDAKTTTEKPNTEDKKAGKEVKKDKDGKAVDESEVLTPRSPQEDPNFQKLTGRVGTTAKGQKTHEKAETSAGSAQSAALSPDNERESKAKAGQVDEMDGAPAGEFSAAAFKAQLMSRINSMQLPANQEEASDFKENNNIDEVSNAATQDVKNEKTAAVGPIEETSKKEPNVAAIPDREIVSLPEAPIGEKPASVNPNKGMPPKRGDVEVSKPLEDNMAEVDQKMTENNITDEQLAKSNEPTFLEGLDSKTKAKENTEQAPQQLRNQEQGILGATKANANATGQLGLQNMHQDRDAALNQVVGQQQETATTDTAERTRIAGEINTIYEKTKTDVDTLLATLDTDVSTLFTAGAEAAKASFENYVEQKMDAYKEDRYSGVTGKGQWVVDKFKGLPDEVNQFFVDGRKVYIDYMDGVITQIAQLVASKLTEAKTRITTGKQEVQDFVLALPDNLQNIGKDAAEAISTKFDELEENVKGKQDELVESLAQQYMEGLNAVDARIEEMKAANRGLIDMVLDAVVGIIKTIISIVNLLTDLLSAVISAIGAIISDPIGFLSNLIDGVKLGFENFGSNILTHLTTGLVEWLTGSLGPMGIKIPADLFSLSGIFDLVAQILGVSWDYIRQKAIKMLGEPAVEALEKGFEVFIILKNEGIAGVWKYIKDEFGDLQVTIMDAIKDMVITKVIDAGIKWVLGLMNPAGAFIKAAIMIVDIVKFFMEKGSQIIELVRAFIDSIRAVASGSIGGVAKTIENALAKAIPVMIGFLASLLGITGLTEKVQKIIGSIRKRIDKAIDGLILKAKAAGRKLLAKIGIGKDPEGGAKPGHEGGDGEIGKTIKFSDGEEGHRLWVDESTGHGVLKVASSDPNTVKNKIAKWEDKLETKEWKHKGKADKKTRILGHITNVKAKLGIIDIEISTADKAESKGEPVPPKVDNAIEVQEVSVSQSLKEIFMEFKEKADLKVIFAENLIQTHSHAKSTVDASVDIISNAMNNNQEIRSFGKLTKWLEITENTNQLLDNPINNKEPYGDYIRKQIDAVGNKAELKDKYEKKKDTIISKMTPGTDVHNALKKQVLNKNNEPESNKIIEQFIKSGSDHNKFKPTNIITEVLPDGSKKITYQYDGGTQQFTTIINKSNYPTEMKGESLTLHDLGRGVTQDSTGKTTGEGQDSSHGVGNQFGGTGYNAEVEFKVNGQLQKIKVSLNLIAASAVFNQVTMLDIERAIVEYIKVNKADTFNMNVKVKYAQENDTMETQELLSRIKSMFNEKTSEALLKKDIENLRKEIYGILHNTIQPRILDVSYVVELFKSGILIDSEFITNTGPDLEYGK